MKWWLAFSNHDRSYSNFKVSCCWCQITPKKYDSFFEVLLVNALVIELTVKRGWVWSETIWLWIGLIRTISRANHSLGCFQNILISILRINRINYSSTHCNVEIQDPGREELSKKCTEMHWLIKKKFSGKTLQKNALICAEMRWNLARNALKTAKLLKTSYHWESHPSLRCRSLHPIHCAIHT